MSENFQSLAVDIKNMDNTLGGCIVHKNLNLQIQRGEIIAIVGGSGSGKTTLLRSILMLNRPISGQIRVFDIDVMSADVEDITRIRRRIGMMFQQGALFSALNLLENVRFPLKELGHLPFGLTTKIAHLKIILAGLELQDAYKYPAELSGGMLKRAAVARAIALDPELLILDEPSSGLDPRNASALDDLILQLRQSLGLTIIVVTHDLDTLSRVPDRVAFLGDKKVLACLPLKELLAVEHPLIQAYFEGPRGENIKKEIAALSEDK